MIKKILFAILIPLLFSSCDNSDDTVSIKSSIEIPDNVNMDLLYKSWSFKGSGRYHTFHPGYHNDIFTGSELSCMLTGYLTFNKDNKTFEQKITAYNSNTCNNSIYNGNFTINGNKVILTYKSFNNDVVKTLEIKRLFGNKLEVFERVSVTVQGIQEDNYIVTYYEN